MREAKTGRSGGSQEMCKARKDCFQRGGLGDGSDEGDSTGLAGFNLVRF